VKHLSLYVIATMNTAPQPMPARPRRAKKRFVTANWLRPFRAARLESREALT
jgi:hypothetical protein